MNQLYALVIRDCQEFWCYQSDLIGIFDSKERAKREFVKWFNKNYNKKNMFIDIDLLEKDYDSLNKFDQEAVDDLCALMRSIAIVKISINQPVNYDDQGIGCFVNDNKNVNRVNQLANKFASLLYFEQ